MRLMWSEAIRGTYTHPEQMHVDNLEILQIRHQRAGRSFCKHIVLPGHSQEVEKDYAANFLAFLEFEGLVVFDCKKRQ